MPAAVFEQLNIVAADLDATIAFYRRLGVRVGDPARTPTGHAFHANSPPNRATLEADSTAFARLWCQGWSAAPDLAGRVVVGLRVETRADVDRLYAEATAAGAPALQPPHDAFWGARYAIIQDPDGLAVGLMSPRDGPHGPPPPIP